VKSESVVDGLEKAFRDTVTREQMTLAEATQIQFRLVDTAQRVIGSDEVFTSDVGQVRQLATVGFGGGGRPRTTQRVERVLADFFEVEECVLVHGAGTGAIRAMLNAALSPASRVVVSSAHPYKTTLPAMQHMGLDVVATDFNEPEVLQQTVRRLRPAALYVQHVPQQLGDRHGIDAVIAAARDVMSDKIRILADDNYAVMRSPRIAVQLGADVSSFSFFKLLSRAQLGAVVGPADVLSTIRRDLSSAGCQVQGADAMEALRMLVYAPVALATQNEVVCQVTKRINHLIGDGELPQLRAAIAGQPGIRSVILLFNEPVAEEFLASAWRNGSPSQSVGEEAIYEFLPLFTYLTGTFLKGHPGLERYAVRVNPMRGGPETVLRVLRMALADREFLTAGSRAGR
jgi:Ni,Fe-hydrogenase III small subunit